MRRSKSDHLRRGDIFLGSLTEHQAARETGELRPQTTSIAITRVARADAERGGDRHRQDNGGKQKIRSVARISASSTQPRA